LEYLRRQYDDAAGITIPVMVKCPDGIVDDWAFNPR
jgi:hypothetical protein